METELLNEYVFASLITQWAANAKAERLQREGKDLNDTEFKMPVGEEDLREAFRRLDGRRLAVAAILREAGQAPK